MKTKKLQLITVSLFTLTILIMIIGLMVIGFCDYNYHTFNQSTKMWEDEKHNGFYFLKVTSIYRILSCSAIHACNISHNNGNFYSWIQLQIGIVFLVILVPILTFIITSLIFLNIGLKIKIKNNNFWDAIQNCEIISNDYIH
ncbi:hypothetical protein [Spiroplasma ixodetis]|uniref:hypothetical protein n=1 Tax=Spiroplasma ixodetis TaxID=2141 RepID=UPI0025766715|nr:hypothetical protein [Spiroplasma ixodetis]WJG69919.1 hypothetical protein SIXOD_v1c09070 [Spiroplasma ixodetis Y32]